MTDKVKLSGFDRVNLAKSNTNITQNLTISFPSGIPVETTLYLFQDLEAEANYQYFPIKIVSALNYQNTTDIDSTVPNIAWVNDTFAGLRGPHIALGYLSLDLNFTSSLSATPIKDAWECALTPCVNTYNTSVQAGVVAANVTSINYGEISFVENQYNSYMEQVWGASVASTSFSLDSQTLFSAYESIFQTVLGNSTSLESCTINTDQCSALTGDTTPAYYYSSEAMKMVQATDNFSQIVENIALSLSDLVQRNGSMNATGQVLVAEVYVRVRWGWITLPVVLVVTSVVLFILAMRQTKAERLRIWKSSNLPFLYHGLYPPRDSTVHANEVSEMEDDAGKMRVRLGRTGTSGTWMLLRSAG